MSSEKVDLIIHPVRLRILQTLTAEALTTQEIAERLPGVPQSSIYRHLKLLLAGEMVDVVETRLVNGIQEKVYRLAALPHLTETDMAEMTADDHLRAFTTYVITLLHGFADYLAATEQEGTGFPLLADRVGYSEIVFFATPEELDSFGQALQEAVLKVAHNPPGNGRHKRKLAIVSYPIKSSGSDG